MRARIIATALLTATTALTALSAAPAQAYSECTTAYDDYSGIYTPGSCLFSDFRLNASDAPGLVTGTVGYKRIYLQGGYSVSGSYGAQRVQLKDYSIAGPNWSGTVGRKKVTIRDGIYGIECYIGGWTYRVSTELVGTNVRVTDDDKGGLCLALILAADLIDEV